MKFLGLLVLGLVIFTLNQVFVLFSPGLFLLPIIPLIRLAHPDYRAFWARGLPRRSGRQRLNNGAVV